MTGATPDITTWAPLLSERWGVAALFALSIWAGVAVVRLWIATQRDIELARIAVQKDLSEAIRAQAVSGAETATALRELRAESAAAGIALSRVAQMVERG